MYLGEDRLTVQHAVITMRLAPDRKTASEGIISGVVTVDELSAYMRRLAYPFAQTCEGPLIDATLDTVRAAADIMSDGGQDPTRICDAVSIGLGFDAVQVELGPVAAPMPFDDPCAP